jgi:hypothetical protein
LDIARSLVSRAFLLLQVLHSDVMNKKKKVVISSKGIK